MVRNFVLAALAVAAGGCTTMEPAQQPGCELLGLVHGEDATFAKPAPGTPSGSVIFDARLLSGTVTQTEGSCRFEGHAPSHRVGAAQAEWIRARAEATCGASAQQLYLQRADDTRNEDKPRSPPAGAAPASQASAGAYVFAVSVVPKKPEPGCTSLADREQLLNSGTMPSYAHTSVRGYPAAAYRNGLEGLVKLLVLVNADGRARAALVQLSSGHQVLDEAAVSNARQWRFNPAMTDDGSSVPAVVRVPVDFRID